MNMCMVAGQVDMAFPVYGNLWELEQNKIDASTAVVQGSESFVFKGTYDKNKIRLIAVNENNQMQIAYCKKIFRMLSWCIVAPLKSVCLKLCKEKRMEPSSIRFVRNLLLGIQNTKACLASN